MALGFTFVRRRPRHSSPQRRIHRRSFVSSIERTPAGVECLCYARRNGRSNFLRKSYLAAWVLGLMVTACASNERVPAPPPSRPVAGVPSLERALSAEEF